MRSVGERILHRRLGHPELSSDLAEGEALAAESAALGALVAGERSAVELHASFVEDLADGALAQAVGDLEVAGLDTALVVSNQGSSPFGVKPHVQAVRT